MIPASADVGSQARYCCAVDALCLIVPDTYRLAGVNGSWTRLFGYSASAAVDLTVRDLAVSSDELLAHLPAPSLHSSESVAHGRWRRADGTHFFATFSLSLHSIGDKALLCLLVRAPALDWSSTLPMVSAIEDEVISESGVSGNLKEAVRERMARCSKQQIALLSLASADDRDFEVLMRRLLRGDSETLDVARVSYWVIGEGRDSIVCDALLDARTGTFESGTELRANDYPKYFRALTTGALVPAHDAVNDPRTSELAESYLRPLGIGALLDIPVFLKGQLVGVVCHEHVGGSRGWTMDEQQFALSIGQMFSLALAARNREDVAISLRQRDTLLAEANAVLERALRPNDGRLTGRVLGRYRMEQIVGRGGAGEVYRAVRTDDDEVVAIKVLHKLATDDPEHQRRFMREARITASVPSHHVARVLEVGTFEGVAPFIAMELLEGHDLSWHLRRSRQLPLEQVVELCDHTARALASVREAGVVHRDLKPNNLFLVDSIPRAWKVLDFGLSRSEADGHTTASEELAGTPHYMAPEQICGDPVDHRADLYALAAIAFRALTGRPPFVGDVQTVLMSALTEPLPPVASLVRGVPVEVDLVFAIALAKDPDARFATVEAFAQALRSAAAGVLDEEVRRAGWRLLKGSYGGRTSGP